MNTVLTTTSGIDTEIQELQVALYDALSTTWLNPIMGYGRVYKTVDKMGKVVPRIYIGSNEYKEVLFDDNTPGSMFFIDGDTHTTEDGFRYSTTVKCVFMLNLDKVITDVERADSEVQRDVVEVIRQYNQGFDIEELEKGVKNVFRGFDQQHIKDFDRQPNHCFSVNVKLSYSINDKCN